MAYFCSIITKTETNAKMKKTILAAALLLSMGRAAAQQEPATMRFDFKQVSGNTVTDAAGGIEAKLMNQAKVTRMGSFGVLDLGNGTGYLDMTAKAGQQVRSLADFTVSVYYRVDAAASLSGAGHFLWCFSQSDANTQYASPYTAYRLNAQRMATSTGGWSGETGMEMGTESEKGRWIHMLYRQKGQKGELFLDGKLAKEHTTMPLLSNAFTAAPAYNWIGRAPFSADSYLKQTLVSDFALYAVALTDAQVAALAAVTADLEYNYGHGEAGDFAPLQQKVDECNAFMAGDVQAYAPNAIAELRDAVTIAEKEIANGRATQLFIDQHVATLAQLLATVRATKGYQPKQGFADTGSDKGFAHPGGIVSQQDIDRARQLLADGDERIKRAWDILCANEYSHADIATWPTPTVIRGGGSGQNYMNCARGAAMAYQNALRWKIGGTRDNADAAVRILMQWARECNGLGGDTNISLAAGIYGYEWANAAELMRDYDGWSRDDFEVFRRWIVRVFYNPAIDFLRRRHDTWLNWRYANLGERPGHYWSNWGLCNALCVMSIGILCDDVHMYNQGISFYKYDHVGTFRDRSAQSVILNDGCNEFIGNLVPVVLPDERGPLGLLGQMQESGRDQGHALMALGLALDICQVGLTQGDDLYAYMNDRIAAGLEHVAALNFGGVDAASLPWITYNYADCRGTMGAAWAQPAPNEGGKGEYRPYWDRAIGYYEGLRGIRLQYAEKASAAVCPDGGGGNYSQNSGGFDHVGFSTLTSWRPAVTASEAITPLSGDIVYKGVTYKNQTNLGGLKYNYEVEPTRAIPADGAPITLIPQLPEGTDDSGQWLWSTGETTRQLTVKADRSYIYRVVYTAQNGTRSQQAFAIAVSGDAPADPLTSEITVDGTVCQDTVQTVLCGSSVVLHAGAATGWTDDYLWDNGQTGSTITIPALTTSRTYICQYANQSGAVSERRFHLKVVAALPMIDGKTTDAATLLPGCKATLQLAIPAFDDAADIVWDDGTTGDTRVVTMTAADCTFSATFHGTAYQFSLHPMGGGQYPIDATSLLVNPDFATIDGTGWTMTGTWGNQRYNGAAEVWHATDFDLSQTVTGLPDGRYTVTCQLANGEGGNTAWLYATSGGSTVKARVKQSCVGSTFDAQRDQMAARATYGRLKVDIDVTGGSLTVGIAEPSLGVTWLVWDNFTLTYHGPTESGISKTTGSRPATGRCYDLQGRTVHPSPYGQRAPGLAKGIYIVDGKKYAR